jgi:hypothetical protein
MNGGGEGPIELSPGWRAGRSFPVALAYGDMDRLTRSGWPSSFPIVQFPNPPLIVALLADIAAHLMQGRAHRSALAVFYMALSVWAYEEARHGDNWFRRLLGLGFSAYIVVALTRALHA